MNSFNETQNVINAFETVSKIYEETSFLIKDFSAELNKLGFVSALPNKVSMGTNGSASLKYPKYWSLLYGAWFFRHCNQKDNCHWICITVSFFDLDLKADPRLLLGVLKRRDNSGEYAYNWLHWAYFNRTSSENSDDKIKFSYNVKDSVYLADGFSTSLLSVKDRSHMEDLLTKVINIWGKE